MIQVSLEVVLADDQRQKFLSILRPLLEPTSCEAGCTRCAVWMNISDERRFRFLTEWQSVADLDRYLESGRFREVLVATELSEEAPVIEIQTISETRGFEYVAQLLGSDSRVATQGENTDNGESDRRPSFHQTP